MHDLRSRASIRLSIQDERLIHTSTAFTQDFVMSALGEDMSKPFLDGRQGQLQSNAASDGTATGTPGRGRLWDAPAPERSRLWDAPTPRQQQDYDDDAFFARIGSAPTNPTLGDGWDLSTDTANIISAPGHLQRKGCEKLHHKLPLSSAWQAFTNLTKAIVGAGSFALPWAFMNMGIWGGFGCLVIISLLSSYTLDLLVRCKREAQRLTLARHMTYVDVAHAAFGNKGTVITYALSVFASMGVASAYIVFIGSNLASIEELNMLTQFEWSAVAGVLLIPLVLLRSFAFLGFTSLLGDFSLLLGMGVTMYSGITTEHIDPISSYGAFHPKTFFLSFGSVAFLFCVHFLVLPIERSLKLPSKFRAVLACTIIVVAATNTAFGFMGYLLFKDDTCSIVVLNLKASVIVTVVKISLCVDLLFTYAIVFAPGREILEKSFLSDDTPHLATKQNILRMICLALTVGVSAVKQFGAVTNIVGGFAMCLLGFVAPPLLSLKLRETTLSEKFGHCLLIVFGVLAAGFTVTLTIIQLLDPSSTTSKC